jgi:hypothetical protein
MNSDDIMKAWLTGFAFGTFTGIAIVSIVLTIFK